MINLKKIRKIKTFKVWGRPRGTSQPFCTIEIKAYSKPEALTQLEALNVELQGKIY